MKRDVLRYGDLVRIVDPRLFIRCGYPMDPEQIQRDMEMKHGAAIWQMIQTTGLHRQHYVAEKVRKRMIRDLAYAYQCGRHFGGRERSIHLTEPCEHLRNVVVEVINKRMVVTGRYYPPGGSYDEYENGGLFDARQHQIIEIRQVLASRHFDLGPAPAHTWIPRAHIERHDAVPAVLSEAA